MQPLKIKTLFILPNLNAGGAERVMSYVAQNIDKSSFDVTLLVVGYEKDSKYDIKGINLVFLNKDRVLKAIPKLFFHLRKAKPDIAISAIGHLNNAMGLLAIFFPKIKFISREVNVNSVLAKYADPVRSFNLSGLFTTISDRSFDKIICQSNDMAEDMRTNHNIKESKLIVINNPITSNFKTKDNKLHEKIDLFQLITVGRLAKQKGYFRIIEALETLKEMGVSFHYTIIGDGPQKKAIFDVIDTNGLSNMVTHIPFTKQVPKYLEKSHLYLQGSYVEGFPNALIESCAIGTPVVAFRAPGGIDEIIKDGINGYIADDLDDFINKIRLILNTIQKWNPAAISDSVQKKYNSEKILKQYENLFKEVLN